MELHSLALMNFLVIKHIQIVGTKNESYFISHLGSATWTQF